MLPPGTQVFVPPYALHLDARNFVFPDVFWPERWLVASGQLPLERAQPPRTLAPSDGVEIRLVHNEAAFIPFSHGPMNCAGRGLAMQQLRTVVCALVQRFRIRLSLSEGRAVGRYQEEFRDSYLAANRVELPVMLESRR